ncbi:hypothetical protein BKA93DRAFT_100167 [Sparassis latifolia]
MSSNAPSNIGVTDGALLMGTFIASVAFGITLMQTYVYFTAFPNDPRLIHATVWVLLIFDTGHITLAWHMMYHWLILNFDNPEALGIVVWSLNITVILTGLITLIVQSFYARRVFILSNRNWFLTITIIILAIVRLVVGIVNAVKFFQLKYIALFPKACGPIVGLSLGAGTAADVLITASLVYLLRGHKTGFNVTDTIVNRIVFYTVNTGLLTSVVGIVVIITFVSIPHDMIYFSIYLTLSKLYINALLATLNARRATRGCGVEDSTLSMSLAARVGGTHQSGQFSMNAMHGGKTDTITPVVHVVTTTTTDSRYPPEDNKTDGCTFTDPESSMYIPEV